MGWLAACLVLAAAVAFGQGGNGTITGTVTDPASAVVPGATVQAKNTQTGVVYTGATSAAGLYTISDLPVGTYSVTASVQGFKTYTHANLALGATQILREDIRLEVGTSAESVTVTEQSTLLKTETGELTHNITLEQMDDLPLLGVGTTNAGTTAIRNPFNSIQALPGLSAYNPGYGFTYDGLATQASIRIEGQDATPHALGYQVTAQPGVDAVQEVAFQTSNYAPEFGTTGSVLVNFTMKSGTNQFHGSLYEYFVNEDLNAGDPFTVNASGVGKLRPRNRRNDFGGTLGGPVIIPKLYNGHNKTFFFFNYEQYLESTHIFNTDTVPTPAYLNGDFSAISQNGTCSLCTAIGVPRGALGTPNIELDPAGQMIFANEIFDPATRAVATSGPKAGQGYASPFPNNMIPPTRFDPTTVDFLNLFQKLGVVAQNSNLVGNYLGTVPGNRYSVIPSFKIDQIISNKDKISYYQQETNLENQVSVGAPFGADGFPSEIGEYRGSFITGWVERLNYDRTISPTLLLHFGVGYYFTYFSDHAAFLNFNPSQFGLTGFVQDRQFPYITGNCSTSEFLYTCLSATGGMQNIGTVGQIQSVYHDNKPTYNANVTWVRGRHTYKTGAELYVQGNPIRYYAGVTLNTGTNATSDPFTPINSLNGFSTGFGFASWLLGDYASTTQTAPYDYRMGAQQWGFYLQDSWKATRKLTLDYGLRYDLPTQPHEQYGRLGQLDMTLPNANAGGMPGATRYASTCGCAFYQPVYPYAIGPRVGVAYQLNPKTVLRGGWGFVYTQVLGAALGSSQGIAGGIVSTNGTYPVAANSPPYIPAASQFVNIETPGSIVPPSWPVTNPYRYPVPGTTGGTPGGFVPDKNQNRPPRADQFSFGIQREITRNFVIEASYVGNRVVWLPTGPLGFLSEIPPAKYAQFGLYPYPGTGPCSASASGGSGVCASSTYNNNNDRALLSLPLSSASVIQKLASVGLTNFLPYTGFPTSLPLQGALYPFPQFDSVSASGAVTPIEPSTSATGNSKYDSLQMKATKRFSHGLQAGGAFTWAKGFTRATRQDFFNPASSRWDLQNIPPLALTFNFTYTVPRPSFAPKFASEILRDWQIGGYALYESAPFLTPPASPTANFLSSEDVRVPGQPLYLVDINNIHSYSPGTQVVLNPAAWAPCPTNSTCTATGTLYPDFRAPRTPTENANFGRNFRVRERMNLFIRAEFVNIFNRTLLPEPITTSPQNAVTRTAGILSGGYGVINTFATAGSQPSSAASSVLGVAPPYLTGRTGTLIARLTF